MDVGHTICLLAQQSVTQEFHIPVWSICKLEDLMTFVQQTATQPENHVASKVSGMPECCTQQEREAQAPSAGLL